MLWFQEKLGQTAWVLQAFQVVFINSTCLTPFIFNLLCSLASIYIVALSCWVMTVIYRCVRSRLSWPRLKPSIISRNVQNLPAPLLTLLWNWILQICYFTRQIIIHKCIISLKNGEVPFNSQSKYLFSVNLSILGLLPHGDYLNGYFNFSHAIQYNTCYMLIFMNTSHTSPLVIFLLNITYIAPFWFPHFHIQLAYHCMKVFTSRFINSSSYYFTKLFYELLLFLRNSIFVWSELSANLN